MVSTTTRGTYRQSGTNDWLKRTIILQIRGDPETVENIFRLAEPNLRIVVKHLCPESSVQYATGVESLEGNLIRMDYVPDRDKTLPGPAILHNLSFRSIPRKDGDLYIRH
jgi:hypothetical protein